MLGKESDIGNPHDQNPKAKELKDAILQEQINTKGIFEGKIVNFQVSHLGFKAMKSASILQRHTSVKST